MSLDINNLGLFYLTLAIVALAIAIVVYPTLKEKMKRKK